MHSYGGTDAEFDYRVNLLFNNNIQRYRHTNT